jgi:hypothetical protein
MSAAVRKLATRPWVKGEAARVAQGSLDRIAAAAFLLDFLAAGSDLTVNMPHWASRLATPLDRLQDALSALCVRDLSAAVVEARAAVDELAAAEKEKSA